MRNTQRRVYTTCFLMTACALACWTAQAAELNDLLARLAHPRAAVPAEAWTSARPPGPPSPTVAGPVSPARRLVLPINPAFARRIGRAKYEFVICEPSRVPSGEPSEERIAADLTRLMEILDARILAQPEEWLWCHRRWRTAERITAARGARP